MLSVVFRADASVALGSGHVMRCLALADALQLRAATCHFICREQTGHLLELIRQRGHRVHALPGVVNEWPADCERVEAIVREHSPQQQPADTATH